MSLCKKGFVLKCQVCGKEVDLFFRCSFCNGNFCVEHRLPENHSCPQAPPRTPLGHWKAKIRKLEAKESPSFPRRTQAEETPSCPKCASERVQTTAYRKDYIQYECLDCGFKWKVPKYQGKKPAYVKAKSWKRPRIKMHGYGLVAGAIALISLLLPWWYFQMSTSLLGVSFSITATADLHKVILSGEVWGNGGFVDLAEEFPLNMWFGQTTTIFILVGGILSLVGGLVSGRIGKVILVLAGISILVSILVYTYGLQTELSELTQALTSDLYLDSFPQIQLFSSGAYSGWSYSSYLYIGSWTGLVSLILAFISASKH